MIQAIYTQMKLNIRRKYKASPGKGLHTSILLLQPIAPNVTWSMDFILSWPDRRENTDDLCLCE